MVSMTFVFLALAAPSQRRPAVVDATPAHEIQQPVPQDSTDVVDRVERVADDGAGFRTSAGDLVEPEESWVAETTAVADRAKETRWPADPDRTRLLIGPTGRSLKQRESYFDVFGLILPSVQVGLTDRVSIGGGAPVFFPGSGHVFWITPKVLVYTARKTDVAVGVLNIAVGHDSLGIAYGVLTRGTPDRAVTVGVGFAHEWGKAAGDGAPIVMMGGERRVSRNLKLVTENYLLRGGGLATGGVRLLGERWAVDLGLAASLVAADYFFVFPTVKVMWKL
jgi:hypothetical protein